mmetsp:Transcript_8118/g.20506  ORF Transcript_8118/g.20506 Transcript_8118/m.20506 type:complete len:222 (+) Transcript_8118:314-979(+)
MTSASLILSSPMGFRNTVRRLSHTTTSSTPVASVMGSMLGNWKSCQNSGLTPVDRRDTLVNPPAESTTYGCGLDCRSSNLPAWRLCRLLPRRSDTMRVPRWFSESAPPPPPASPSAKGSRRMRSFTRPLLTPMRGVQNSTPMPVMSAFAAFSAFSSCLLSDSSSSSSASPESDTTTSVLALSVLSTTTASAHCSTVAPRKSLRFMPVSVRIICWMSATTTL